LAIFNGKLASKNEYFQLFLVCLLPIHVWAIINLMKRASSLVLSVNSLEIFGVVAYVLLFALFESLIAFAVLFTLSLILPARIFSSRLIPVGTILVLLASVSAVFIHLYDAWEIENIEFDLWAGMWSFVGLVATAPSVYLIRRDKRIGAAIQGVVDRLSVLSMIYLLFDIFGLAAVIIRNIL
jgi:hypothetical protein